MRPCVVAVAHVGPAYLPLRGTDTGPPVGSSGRRPVYDDTSPQARRRFLAAIEDAEPARPALTFNERITERERLVELAAEAWEAARAELQAARCDAPRFDEISGSEVGDMAPSVRSWYVAAMRA